MEINLWVNKMSDTLAVDTLFVETDGSIGMFVSNISYSDMFELVGVFAGVFAVWKGIDYYKKHLENIFDNQYEDMKSDYENGDYKNCVVKCRKMLRGRLLTRKQKMKLNYSLGYVLLKQRKHEEAMIYFNKVLQKESMHRPSLNCLGACLETLGKKEEAVKVYRDACDEHNLNYPNPWNGLGVLYFEEGKLEEAVYYYEKAVGCKQNTPNFYKGLLGCKMEQKFVSNLMEAYIASGELTKAQDFYRNNIDDLKGFRGNFLLAVCQMLEGKALDGDLRARLIEDSVNAANIGYSPSELKDYLIRLDCISDKYIREVMIFINQIEKRRKNKVKTGL